MFTIALEKVLSQIVLFYGTCNIKKYMVKFSVNSQNLRATYMARLLTLLISDDKQSPCCDASSVVDFLHLPRAGERERGGIDF